MEFQKSAQELIRKRKSSRTYETVVIDTDTWAKLEDYVKLSNAQSSDKARFVLVDIEEMAEGPGKKLGTYGMIAGARSFIVGVVSKENKDELAFGYLFEKIILFATDLGLQTCWLGGSFNRKDFGESVDLRDDELLAIVSPVGIAKEKLRLPESLMRKAIGADHRKPWGELFFDGDESTPLTEKRAGAYAVPLEMVRLGPSASNKQPWRVVYEGPDDAGHNDRNGAGHNDAPRDGVFHFYLCATKGYGATGFDMQLNDIGIAKCHFELAAEELGLHGAWVDATGKLSPDEWRYITTWVPADAAAE
ncbi:MAG: nitroreductase [Coriobacteriia bacterium]|nr:nitroreductase [Coriobacteriia bacterium]